jgi:hypothetical protein
MILELPYAIAQFQQAVANYSGLQALILNARAQVVSAVTHVGGVLYSLSHEGNRAFPSYMSDAVIREACNLLDLVEDPDFVDNEDVRRVLTDYHNREVYKCIFELFQARYSDTPSSLAPMDVTSQDPEVTSQDTPPSKRARQEAPPVASSSTMPPPPLPFPMPEPMSARSISGGGASASSIPSSQGDGRSAGSSSKTNKRKRKETKKW